MSVNQHARIHVIFKRSLGIAALGLIVAAAGCGGSQSNSSQSVTDGAAQPIAAASTANSYIVTDNAGNPHAIGVTIQAKALSNPPTVVNYPNALPFTLPLPAGVPSTVPFHSIT